jgi:cell pole-organizing protein PopZ
MSAASAFGALERTVMMPAAGRNLEDVVRELLRPMMKDWLDQNLPGIVEAQVAAEVERIARQRR